MAPTINIISYSDSVQFLFYIHMFDELLFDYDDGTANDLLYIIIRHL